MTDKFTPGPWFITGTNTKYVEARIGGGMLQEVASVGPTFADNGYGEQQAANATLISAAPELLHAAVEAYELLKVIHDETGKVGMQLQAAIAKAMWL